MISTIIDITIAFTLGALLTGAYVSRPVPMQVEENDYFKYNMTYLCHNKKVYMQMSESSEANFKEMCKDN